MIPARNVPRGTTVVAVNGEEIATTPRKRTYHGGKGLPEYQIWKAMIMRCRNPKNTRWSRYGGRGIHVCSSWTADFAAFLRDMGQRPTASHVLDRINNDGHYEPGNCRWATWEESNRNTGRNRWITLNGERKTLTEWAIVHGLNPATVDWRRRNGWPLDKIFGTRRKNQWA